MLALKWTGFQENAELVPTKRLSRGQGSVEIAELGKSSVIWIAFVVVFRRYHAM
jgi:hypothetical protein